MKTGVENGMCWSEIGSGFGEPRAHPYREFQGVPPPPPREGGLEQRKLSGFDWIWQHFPTHPRRVLSRFSECGDTISLGVTVLIVSYWAVLSCGAVCYAVQGGSNF